MKGAFKESEDQRSRTGDMMERQSSGRVPKVVPST